MNLLLRMAAMLTLAVAGQAASHASGIYKWVDEKGITHYSQDPPPQGRFERFESERPASSPAPLCNREPGPRWQNFLCRFMTQDLWRRAGRPRLGDPARGAEWIPIFYRGGRPCLGDCSDPAEAEESASGSFPENEGLIEGFQEIAGSGAGAARRRYAPWSVHIKRELGCSGAQTSNPYRIGRERLPRAEILGLGWDKLARDAADPTDDLEAGSMFVLFTTANLRVLLEPDQAKLIDEHTLTQIAFGTTALMRPDFDRNAEMALVRPEGTVEPLRDTAVAVDVLSTVRLVFVNDAARGWADALADAVFTVQYFGAPAVLVYNAADFFSLERDNPAIRDRLRVLADGVNRRGSSLNVVAHGWGAYLSIAALHTHPRANITAVNPYPGPWRAAEFRQALRDPRPALALARAKPPRG